MITCNNLFKIKRRSYTCNRRINIQIEESYEIMTFITKWANDRWSIGVTHKYIQTKLNGHMVYEN